MRPGRAPESLVQTGFQGWGLAGAVSLHLAVLWPLLPHGAGREGVPLADPPVIEIEMVDQAEQAKGAAAPDAGQPPPPPPEPEQPKPPPQQKAEDPSPPPPPPPAPKAPPGRVAAPAVNLGDSDEDQDALRVTGDNVVPPRPDAIFHNRAPTYPPDAARRGREGTVLVRARIGTAGVPEAVTVAGTSGDASLDRAAQQAVQLWRFQPARSNGVPVSFDYEVNIRFRLGDR